MKQNFIGVTRALAIAGATDFRFCDEEAAWRGSEVHRACELLDRGTLFKRKLPENLRGYLAAWEKAKREMHIVILEIEQRVQSKELGVVGKLDRIALVRGSKSVIDLKATAKVNEATRFQLSLYGHIYDPTIWWNRIGLGLKPDGNYSVGGPYEKRDWPADLAMALWLVKWSKWKQQHGLG